jgi:hypothetical protein
MADLDAYIGQDDLANKETVGLLNIGHMYLSQHWGIRQSQSAGAGFGSEAASETLLGGIQIRIDAATKPKTDYVGLVEKVDVRKNDHFTLFIGNRKLKLTVSAVTQRGDASEVELKNG